MGVKSETVQDFGDHSVTIQEIDTSYCHYFGNCNPSTENEHTKSKYDYLRN